MTAPRTLQVVDSLGMGGAETWLMEVLRLWSRTGAAKMDFLVTSGGQGVFDEEAEALGAIIHYLPYGKRNLTGFANGFRRLLRDGAYDVLHDHQDYPSGWHFLLGQGVAPPMRVTHVHNAAYQILNNNGLTVARRLSGLAGKALVSRFATHIAGTSRQLITEYGFDEPAFRHIPRGALHCGLDTDRFTGDRAAARALVRETFDWPADARVILFAGRMDQAPDPGGPQNNKNSGFSVAVATLAMKLDPHLHMLLAGQESDAVAVLKARIAQAGLTDRIHFAGVRKDIARLMLGSDLLFFPSRGEGLGMVAVEAQAAGLPVLTSTAVPRECAVIPDLVTFRDLADDYSLWADDLISLANRAPDIPDANAQVAASTFGIHNSAQALIDLYTAGKLPGS